MYQLFSTEKMIQMKETKLIYMIILKEIHFNNRGKVTRPTEKIITTKNWFFKMY